MQAILLLSIVILIYFVLRYLINVIIDARARLKEESGEGDEPESQAMVRCAHCGIHLPQSEAYYDGQHTYCSEGHMQKGPKDLEFTSKNANPTVPPPPH
ncbi:PP0621 family protein [Thiomicrospira microaerophila]|uniref:PP0621 family protein n=1 Tax=Thiomicrospira microaerophila TaxID=406020 RepID=UPI000695ADBE|nr:PP0621 family protein [Thiomicrospira microaerophila]